MYSERKLQDLFCELADNKAIPKNMNLNMCAVITLLNTGDHLFNKKINYEWLTYILSKLGNTFFFVHHSLVSCYSQVVRWEKQWHEASELLLPVCVSPHQSQQTTNFIDGSNAAEEAHGHWQRADSNEDIWSHLHCVRRFFCRRWGKHAKTHQNTSIIQIDNIQFL